MELKSYKIRSKNKLFDLVHIDEDNKIIHIKEIKFKAK